MAGFDQMDDYYFRTGNLGHTFDVEKLVRDLRIEPEVDLIRPYKDTSDVSGNNDFPYGCLFKSYGKSGFIVVLEDGTYYLTIFTHLKKKFANNMLGVMKREVKEMILFTKMDYDYNKDKKVILSEVQVQKLL